MEQRTFRFSEENLFLVQHIIIMNQIIEDMSLLVPGENNKVRCGTFYNALMTGHWRLREFSPKAAPFLTLTCKQPW